MRKFKVMKKIIFPFLLIVLSFGLNSCDSWLDLRPESEILLDDYWQSEDDVNAVLASCYRGLTTDDVLYRMIVWGELRSDNLVVGPGINTDKRYGIQQILNGNLTPGNAYCSWGSFYAVINYCNTLLKYAPTVVEKDENFTTADLHRVQSEALGLRALSYFYLVRAFKEVPLVLEASVSDDQNFNYKKQSEDVVLQQILADLKESLKYIPSTYGTRAITKGRLTRSAIYSIMADVYLWQNDYKNCISACESALDNAELKFESTTLAFPYLFYVKNSEESIFELQFAEGVQVNNPVMTLYNGYSTVGELGFPVTLSHNISTLATGSYSPFNYSQSSTFVESKYDLRVPQSFISAGASYASINKYYRSYIYSYVNGEPMLSGINILTTTPNWIVYRMSDVLLMAAEAYAQLGTDEDLIAAVTLCNYTYTRANAGSSALDFAQYTSKEDVQKLVLRERQREFLFEGKRWFDLVRLARREGKTTTMNDYIDHKSSGNAKSLGAATLNAMYMPIATSELKANPNLVQNPFYETSSTSSR